MGLELSSRGDTKWLSTRFSWLVDKGWRLGCVRIVFTRRAPPGRHFGDLVEVVARGRQGAVAESLSRCASAHVQAYCGPYLEVSRYYIRRG